MTTSPAPGHPMPFTRLEIALLSPLDGRLQVLLARRAEAPQAGRWALPGGVLRLDLDASLDDAARRIMRERLGFELPYLRQLLALGGPVRDSRAPWALSIVYRAVIAAEDAPLRPGKRIEALAWRPADEAAADGALPFGHASIIARAVAATRTEVESLSVPHCLLPAAFVLSELQSTCEALLGRPIDKSSFRRKLGERALVEPLEGQFRGGANRPAQLYRWAHTEATFA